METIKFYYVRDEERKPRITVCLLKANGDIARGISVCSKQDNPCKKTGRNIARGRAVAAMKARENINPAIRWQAYQTFGDCDFYSVPPTGANIHHKSAFNPRLTEHERRLLGGA